MNLKPAPTAQSPNLQECRRHFGSEPTYFWAKFKGQKKARLLDVDQVWEAHRQGKKAVSFELAPLLASERSMLRALADLSEQQS